MIKLLLFFIFLSTLVSAKSLEEMVGQMILVGVGGDKPSDKWVKQLGHDIEEGRASGVILFKNNIVNPKQLKKLTTFFTAIRGKYPAFVAVDQEGGEVQRLDEKNGFNTYLSAREMARLRTLSDSYKSYKKMADELKKYGFNINFAPVVDIDINPNSPAIGAKKRSFSAQEEIVIAYSAEFLRAHRDAGVITVLKHFPGHGSALKDSHKQLTDVSKTWEYRELKPYYDFIKSEKADAVMVAHVNLKIFDSNYPASLSKKIIKGLLREELGFNGVVFSDDMMMKAISDKYGFEQSIILAINAGVDVLVYSSYFTKKASTVKEVREIILEAIKSGKIDKSEIEDSYERIIRLKNGIT